MKIAAGTDALTQTSDLLVLFIPEKIDFTAIKDYPELSGVVQKLGDIISVLVEAEQFIGKPGQIVTLQTHGKIPAKQVALIGVGDSKSITMRVLQESAATAGRWGKEHNTKQVIAVIPECITSVFGLLKSAQGFSIGFIISAYVFDRYKHKKNSVTKEIDSLTLVAAGDQKIVTRGVNVGRAVAESICFARDMINEPPSVTTPSYLAAVAQQLATADGKITTEILGPAEMKTLGMGALLAIAQGSTTEPRFIVLRYNGGGKRTIALVGKGITFDTGGLSLKTADGMETMKLDMSGAAAVLAVFKLLPQLGLSLNVVGLISSTENMPGPDAVKPGDIAVAMNGKSIEILNTDAEGRVVLADAMSYADQKVKPEVIIDLATLTGACMIALGTDVAGLFSNDKTLAGQLLSAADMSGEKLWELPLVAEYRKLLDSPVADIKNIAGRYGGAITGALFIQDFIPAGTAWAHLDIAGPSFAEKDTPLVPRGGTGYGIQLITEYLVKTEQNQEK